MIGAIFITTLFNLIAYLIIILILQYLCFAHLNLSNKNLLLCTIITAAAMLGTQLFDMRTICDYVIYIMYFGTILVLSSKRLVDLLLSLLAFLLYLALNMLPLYVIEKILPGLNITLHPFGVEYQAGGLIIDITMLIILFGIHFIASKYTYRSRLSTKEVLLSIILPFFSWMICGMLYLTVVDSLWVTLSGKYLCHCFLLPFTSITSIFLLIPAYAVTVKLRHARRLLI